MRLTLWYTLLFGVMALAGFLLVYLNIVYGLNRQTDDQLRAAVRECIENREHRGPEGLQQEFNLEAESTGKGRVFFRLLNGDGVQVMASDLGPWEGLGQTALPMPTDGAELVRLRRPGDSRAFRAIGYRFEDGDLLQIGLTVHENDLVLERYRETFTTAFLLILALGGIGAFFIARRAMGGVREVTQAAARVAKGELDIPITAGDRGREIEELARMFNTMQERIALLLGEMKAVINNIAHDLRRPLTRMRGIAETTITRDADREALRDMAVTIIEECDRLGAQVNTILEIAEIDAGINTLNTERMELGRIVRAAVELYQPAAEEKGISLTLQIADNLSEIRGNRHALQRLMANLLDNAVKFTPRGGWITVTVGDDLDEVLLTVSDSGPGIAPEDRERVFARFYRADTSRSTPGSGLGLALVRSIVTAHQGTVRVESNGRDGSHFIVTFPKAS